MPHGVRQLHVDMKELMIRHVRTRSGMHVSPPCLATTGPFKASKASKASMVGLVASAIPCSKSVGDWLSTIWYCRW